MDQQGIRKTYKYKLIPTPAQAQALEEVLSRCRTLYNVVLDQRKTWWQRGQDVSATYYQQAMELPDLKAACPDYAEVNAQVLQDVLRRLDKTFHAFVRRVKVGEKPGYPRFQGWGRYNSFTYPQYGGGAVLDGGVLSPSRIGHIFIRIHRPLEGIPKTVTICKEADGWYACISCVEVPIQPLVPTGHETGIDVGLKVFLITAEGKPVEHPRHDRKAQTVLRCWQRAVARKQQGSQRRKKAVALLKRKHQQMQRQRLDFQHKTALALLETYDTISLEDVQVRTLVRNPPLATRISDASWGQFRAILDAKAVWARRRVVVVPAQYTSQECSGCGERVRKSLSVRTHACTHVCPSCGLVLDRDENAALNILALVDSTVRRAVRSGVNAGCWAIRSLRSPGFSCGEHVTIGRH